jgi:quinol monooxygenase YgiN
MHVYRHGRRQRRDARGSTAILAAQVAPTRAEPACINYDFHVEANDPNVFMFYENWRSKDDLDAHLQHRIFSRSSRVSTSSSRGLSKSSSVKC